MANDFFRTPDVDLIVKGFALQKLQQRFFKVDSQVSDQNIKSSAFDTDLVSPDEPDTSTIGNSPPEMSFGQPIFTNLEFANGQFQDNDNEVIAFDGVRLDTVLMTVSMSKNIVQTAIQGRNGTIKEYASDGDFIINVRGVIAARGQNEYPQNEVEALARIFTVPTSIKIHSEFLERFGYISPAGMPGISEVVIEGFDFPQQEGFRNIQLFTCTMISDTPIELDI